jgi:multiple sugar transport system substrate-binding protein
MVLLLCPVPLLAEGGKEEEVTELKVLAGAWPTMDKVKAKMLEYEKKTGIKVTFESVPYMELHGKMMVALTAQEGLYDLITLNPDWAPALLAEGFLHSYEEFLKDSDITDSDFDVEDFFPSSMERFMYRGEVYGFPFESGAFVNYYRTDLFEERGLDAPMTWDEYSVAAKKCTLDTNGDGTTDIFGAAVPGSRGAQTAIEFITLLWSFDGEVLDEAYNPTFNNAAGRKALQYEADLVHKHKVTPPGILEYSYDGLAPLFLEGKLAMVTSWVHVTGMAADPSQSKVVDKWWFARRPGVGWTGTWALCIPSDSKAKKAAYDLAQYVTTKEAIRELADQGVASTRASVMRDPTILNKYPTLGPIIDAIENARPVFFSLVFEEMFDILTVNISNTLAGEISVREALDKAEGDMRDLFERSGFYD